MPWLLALTGARVGEIAQLWGRRVTEKDVITVLRFALAEDGGSLKTETSERDVPVHPALVERGFLRIVKTRANGGPLFYGGKKAKPAAPRKSETSRHASVYVARDVQEWILGNGFTNPRKAPNHAFRHWFETKCTKLNIDPAIRDALEGRSGTGLSSDYQHIREGTAAHYEAICSLPVPKLNEPSETSGVWHDGSTYRHHGVGRWPRRRISWFRRILRMDHRQSSRPDHRRIVR